MTKLIKFLLKKIDEIEKFIYKEWMNEKIMYRSIGTNGTNESQKFAFFLDWNERIVEWIVKNDFSKFRGYNEQLLDSRFESKLFNSHQNGVKRLKLIFFDILRKNIKQKFSAKSRISHQICTISTILPMRGDI